MIGLDLDGTVLNERKEITDCTRETIQRAIAEGIIVLPATGRPLDGIPEEILQIEGIRYVLSANGAVIYDLQSHIKLHEDCMDYQEVLEILLKMREIEIMADVFIDGVGYVEKESFDYNIEFASSDAVRKYLSKTRHQVGDLPAYIKERAECIQKMTINFRPLSDGTLFRKKEVLTLLKPYTGLSIVSGMATNLEITKNTATKGRGLLVLGSLLGIKPEEIMAFGDSGNDREMIETVGLGVAMGNSTKDVLEAADYVTKSNEDDGVAYAINKFVLNKD